MGNEQPKTKTKSYEDICKERIEYWHHKLDHLPPPLDISEIERIKLSVDVELSIAELKIKSRQADHAKELLLFYPWIPVIISSFAAIISVFHSKLF